MPQGIIKKLVSDRGFGFISGACHGILQDSQVRVFVEEVDRTIGEQDVDAPFVQAGEDARTVSIEAPGNVIPIDVVLAGANC